MTSLQSIEKEIQKIDKLIPILTKDMGKHVSELPQSTVAILKSIKLAPTMTMSGLEPINPIIDWLLYARFLAKEYLAGKLTLG